MPPIKYPEMRATKTDCFVKCIPTNGWFHDTADFNWLKIFTHWWRWHVTKCSPKIWNRVFHQTIHFRKHFANYPSKISVCISIVICNRLFHEAINFLGGISQNAPKLYRLAVYILPNSIPFHKSNWPEILNFYTISKFPLIGMSISLFQFFRASWNPAIPLRS